MRILLDNHMPCDVCHSYVALIALYPPTYLPTCFPPSLWLCSYLHYSLQQRTSERECNTYIRYQCHVNRL